LKKIKYTPDAADKLREIKRAISQEYGADVAKKIVKSITDAIRGLCDYEEKVKTRIEKISLQKGR